MTGPFGITSRKPRRTRVVLAQNRPGRRVVRTEEDVREQTELGRRLARSQRGRQLRTTLGFGLPFLALQLVTPLSFLAPPAIPGLGWIMLGGMSFPLMIALGWLFQLRSERIEWEFAELLDR